MIEDVRAQLNGSRNEFENNVRDSFGEKICRDVYEPFDLQLAELEQAITAAHNEQQLIKNLLSTLRAIL